jgi:predicted dehydrogenase
MAKELVVGNRIAVGIAGLGRSGWSIHASTFRSMTDTYKVAAVFDVDAARREEAVKDFGASAYESFDALLADDAVELVVVATPSNLHVEHSMRALNAGKHVVSEKPMATSLADAEKVVAAAAGAATKFAVFQNRRWQYDFQKVKEIIDSGVLGDVTLINIRWNGFGRRWDWQTLKKNGGGTLNNTGPHVVDHALQLFGDVDPDVVLADLGCMLTSGDAEDHVKIVIKGKGRPVVDIEISSGVAYAGDRWTVSGTKGGLRGTADELWWKYFDPAKYPAPPVDEKPTADRSYNRLPMEFTEEHWKQPEGGPSPETQFYSALFAALRSGGELPIKAESVLRQMRLIARAKELSPCS